MTETIRVVEFPSAALNLIIEPTIITPPAAQIQQLRISEHRKLI